MRCGALSSLVLLSFALAACSAAPALAPVAPKARIAAPRAGAVPAAAAIPVDPPALVAQRLPFTAKETPLDAEGKLFLVNGADGIHVVDVATGETHGVLSGSYSRPSFAPGGHQIITFPIGKKVARIWDLRINRMRDVPLARAPEEAPDHLVTLGGPPSVAVIARGGFTVIDIASGKARSFDLDPNSRSTVVSRARSGALAASDSISTYLFDASGELTRTIKKGASAIALDPGGKRAAMVHGNRVAILDVASAEEPPETTPCPDSRATDLAWSDDGRHLFVACFGSTRSPSAVISLSTEGAIERELLHDDKESLAVSVEGDRVVVSAPKLGVVVFDPASGREIHRLQGPGGSLHLVSVAANLESALFREDDVVASLTLVERGLPARSLHLPSPASAGPLEAEGPLLRLSRGNGDILFDPLTGKSSPAPAGTLAPDGKTRIVVAEGKMELVNLAGKHQLLSATRPGVLGAPRFSPRGGWVVFDEENDRGTTADRHVLHLFNAVTGHEVTSPELRGARSQSAFAPDDALIAVVVRANHPPRPGGTCLEYGLECEVIRVLDPRTGRRLAEIRADDRMSGPPEFFDARRVLVRNGVYDARTGHLAWTLPYGARVTAVLPGSGHVLLDIAGKSSVVEAASGALVKEIDTIQKVPSVSADGAVLLGVAAGATSVWNTSTWTATQTRLTLDPTSKVILSNDGRLAYLLSGTDLFVYRLTDSRTLWRVLPGFDFDHTPDGQFDFTPGGEVAMRVRSGANIESSPLGPLALLGERRHPDLYRDFVAAP